MKFKQKSETGPVTVLVWVQCELLVFRSPCRTAVSSDEFIVLFAGKPFVLSSSVFGKNNFYVCHCEITRRFATPVERIFSYTFFSLNQSTSEYYVYFPTFSVFQITRLTYSSFFR